jgi:STE24 endopeptidase
LYSKTEPPKALEGHFDKETFSKSQAYGKDKAQFSLIAGFYRQILESAMIHYGTYAWAWTAAGGLIAKLGYGPEYEVCLPLN